MVNPTFSWNPGCEVVVLVEEYIDGDEFDVDVLMWQGQAVYRHVVDNVCTDMQSQCGAVTLRCGR
jgi:hypothetical protein